MRKKNGTKVGLIVLALMTMITINACSKVNNDTANDVCAALEEKYGESFVAVKIGDRLNTDHAKLYIYSESNSSLLFTATINRDSKQVEDDYVVQKVNHAVDSVITKIAKAEGLTAFANCCVITREPLQVDVAEWTPEAFQQKYGFENYLVYLCVSSNGLTAEKLYRTMKQSSEELGVAIRYRVYVFEDNHYQECIIELQKMPDANATAIEKFTPTKTLWNDVDKGSSSYSTNDIDNILKEG